MLRLLDEARVAREASDYRAARAKAAEAVGVLLAVPETTAHADSDWSVLLRAAGAAAWNAQDPPTARAAFERVLEVRSRTLPEDHSDLTAARHDLAVVLSVQGDLDGARALLERVLEVESRTLPEDHPDLQRTRSNLAATIKEQGDLAGARALEERVLEVLTRALPEDHLDLQGARLNLAGTIKTQGDFAGARVLQERALAVYARTLPEDHHVLQLARGNLAGTMRAQGDFASARALAERVLAVFARTLPEDHPDLQAARLNLAAAIAAQGDLAGARALEERVLDVWSRTLPEDHHDLQRARGDLAATMYAQGDFAGARALFERVLAVRSSALPEDHHDLQRARGNLALALHAQGDLDGARAIEEHVLEVWSRTLPEDHHDLQRARQNLATTMGAQGDLDGACALLERVLEVFTATLPDDHHDVQRARHNLAVTIAAAESRARGAGETTKERESERELARERCVDLIGAFSRAHASAARTAQLSGSAREAEESCAGMSRALDAALSFACGRGVFEPLPSLDQAAFALGESMRGAALGAARIQRLAAASPRYGEIREALRGAADEITALAQSGTTSGEFQDALARREGLEREIVVLAIDSGAGAHGALIDVERLAAVLPEDAAAVAYFRYERWTFPVGSASDTGETRLCALVLRAGEADEDGGQRPARVARVELGPLESIDSAVRAWREALSAGLERGMATAADALDAEWARGLELRALVLDPVIAAAGDTRHLVVALDDVLHLVPLDALPLGANALPLGANALPLGADALPLGDDALPMGSDTRHLGSDARPLGGDRQGERAGDRWRIETRATLSELCDPTPRARTGVLVALGGPSFNSRALGPDAQDHTAAEVEESLVDAAVSGEHVVAALLRGGAWERGFEPLTFTRAEARGVAELFDEVFADESASIVLEQQRASRASLEELAPRARFLHIATHGWFAPESIRSWSDPEPLDARSGLGTRMSGEEQVKGMSPMLLCGLALAGANLPEDELGRAPGLVTADELSTLDLTGCELVVLSACDTNVGLRRAGQGVASLQRALQMAGAHSVITSLWKVPDEATKELMLDFYRRLWVEQKPKHRALWEAKAKLREARDERGDPKYTPRDWAAWVLTGDPF